MMNKADEGIEDMRTQLPGRDEKQKK